MCFVYLVFVSGAFTHFFFFFNMTGFSSVERGEYLVSKVQLPNPSNATVGKGTQ